jgi:hypothetical protein
MPIGQDMRPLHRVGIIALIAGVKCLRRALSAMADVEDTATGRIDPTAGAAEIRAIRIEMDRMQASLRAIKATLGADASGGEEPLLQ